MSATIMGLMGLAGLIPVVAYAQACNPSNTADAIQCGASNSAGVPVSTNPTSTLNTTASNIINVLSLLVGAVAVVMIIVGGFRFVSSSGNQEAIASARKTITYAVVGLVVAVLAQLIVHYVLNTTTKATTASSSSSTSGSGSSATGTCGASSASKTPC